MRPTIFFRSVIVVASTVQCVSFNSLVMFFKHFLSSLNTNCQSERCTFNRTYSHLFSSSFLAIFHIQGNISSTFLHLFCHFPVNSLTEIAVSCFKNTIFFVCVFIECCYWSASSTCFFIFSKQLCQFSPSI